MGTAWNSTLYGGLMGSNFYQAGTFGISKDLGTFGALALDATSSSAQIDWNDMQSLQGGGYSNAQRRWPDANSTGSGGTGDRHSTG